MSDGVLSVGVYETGGRRLIDGGDITELAAAGSWKNVIDAAAGTSIATVTLQKCEQPDVRLDYITPFLHELRISLDNEIVFEGPIFQYAAQISKGAQIVAYDMSAWFAWREVLDQFDWSTGAPISTIISGLVTSALNGGPAWPNYDYMNMLPYLNVQPIPKVVNRQNGSLTQYVTGHYIPGPIYVPAVTNVFAQGARPLTDPHEIVWDAYLSYFVGKQVHMSCQGRQVNFWPYGTSLEQLAPADVADFIDFPNLVRDGAKFVTSATCQVRDDTLTMGNPGTPPADTYGAHIGADGFSVISNLTSGVEIPFYVGQALSTDSSLTLPIGTEFVGTQWFAGYPGASDPSVTVSVDNLFLANVSVGANVKGEVFGHAGGKHPLWPVLVARERSEPDVVGRDQAAIIAASMLQTDVPFDSLDVGEFDVVLTSDTPWDFRTIVPGYTALITTRLGGINLQVSSTMGSWSNAKLTLTVGFRTLPATPGTLPDNRVYIDWGGNGQTGVDPDLINVDTTNGLYTHRRFVGDTDVAATPTYVNSPSRPAAFFFPPNTMVGIASGTDLTHYQAVFTGYGTLTLTDQDYDLLVLACKTGAGF